MREGIKTLTSKLIGQQKNDPQVNALKYTTVNLKQKSTGNNFHQIPNKMHKLLSQRESDLNMDLLDVENPVYESKNS
jgi:hypothetical protein